ncbi:MAG: MFS transporter, partial [Actinomycetota bacterium]|nr:MFS transporter [Actinomycetota bacterium]
AVALFVAGSLLSGIAWDSTTFFGGRVLAGLALAAALPNGLGVLNALYPAEGRGRERAFGLWATAIGAAAVLGPLIGGAAAATAVSWRWAFLGAIPLGLIASLGIRVRIPDHEPGSLTDIDLGGALLLAVTVGGLALAVDIGARDWIGPPDQASGYPMLPAVLLLISAAALVALIAVERHRFRRGRPVIAPPAVLRSPSFRLATISSAFMSVGDTGFQLALPLLLGFVLGASEIGVGAVLACYGVGALFGGPIAARLSRHVDDRLVARLALASLPLLLLALLPLLSEDAPLVAIAALLVAYGLAWAVAYARLINMSYQGVPEQDSAVAGGVQSAMRLLAGALGAAILTATFAGVAANRVDDADDLDAQTHIAIAERLDPSDAISSHQRLEPDPQPLPADDSARVAEDAYTAGARAVILLAAAITAIALFVALRIPKPAVRS